MVQPTTRFINLDASGKVTINKLQTLTTHETIQELTVGFGCFLGIPPRNCPFQYGFLRFQHNQPASLTIDCPLDDLKFKVYHSETAE